MYKILGLTGFIFLGLISLVLAENVSPRVTISTDNEYRYIQSNGIPDHTHGIFPNRYNPNFIRPQDYKFRVPLKPNVSPTIHTLQKHEIFGVAINGIPFDPATAEFYNNDANSGWNVDALSSSVNLGLDQSNAHVQPNGAYHYHGAPHEIVRFNTQDKHSEILGYAADGFPIYAYRGYTNVKDPTQGIKKVKASYRLKFGNRASGPKGVFDGTYVQDFEFVPNSGDLDECNGRFGIAPGYPEGTYHYFLTDHFPFVPRCIRGTFDQSFAKPRPAQRNPVQTFSRGLRPYGGDPDTNKGSRGQGDAPPKEAIVACRGQRAGGSCEIKAAPQIIPGTCRQLFGKLTCVPNHHR